MVTKRSALPYVGRAIAVMVVAVVGVLAIYATHAATLTATSEAESGTVIGNAAKIADSSASNGSVVRFGTATGSGSNTVYTYRLFGGSDDPNRIGTGNMNKYDVYLLSPSMVRIAQAVKQQNPQAKTYMYKDPSSTRTTSSCVTNAIGLDWGVDYCDANTNHTNWFMTKGGQRFEYNGYAGHWHVNVGASGYKERYASNVLEDMRKNPGTWDGVFLDNMMSDIRAYVPGSAYPDQYSNNQAAQTAYSSFMTYVGAQLSSAGFGTMGNNNGARLVPGLWASYTAGATGGYDEFWTTFGGSSSSANNLPLYDNVGWEAQIAEADLMHTQGKLGVFTAQTNGTCTECRMYGYASYLLIADGRQAYAEGNVDSEVGNWVGASPIYSWDLGSATSGRTQPQTNLFQRAFAKGLVLVNADSAATRTVSLPGTYLNESGQPVTSVTVNAERGRILRTP